MIALLQRVKQASVLIGSKTHSSIGEGYLLFLGIAKDDSESDAQALAQKIANLRIMPDDEGKMNRSIKEVKGQILVISQFTLCANMKGGRRPDFFYAMEPEKAELLYKYMIKLLSNLCENVKSGVFGAKMEVVLTNDGPVTFILDSSNL